MEGKMGHKKESESDSANASGPAGTEHSAGLLSYNPTGVLHFWEFKEKSHLRSRLIDSR